MIFNDDSHSIILSDDGSYTAYSKEYNEHYHSTKDGALYESLNKHVIPAFKLINKDEVNILDICYGLGFNTLATIFYYSRYRKNVKLNIYSPELDIELVKSLKNFIYPKEFEELREIIENLSNNGVYESKYLYVELFLGDAREYIKKFRNKFDIVYQDAFSPSTNPILWTREYFGDIAKSMREDAVLTTYSTAFKTRLALYENGFYIYLNKGLNYRDATVASFSKNLDLQEVDMKHKIMCNCDIKSLRDNEV